MVTQLDLPTPEGWEAELTCVVGYTDCIIYLLYSLYTRMVYLSADSQPSTYSK